MSSTDTICTRVADLRCPADLDATVSLLDMYAREPMGAARALSEEVRSRLYRDLPELEQILVFLAEDTQGEPLGIAFCVLGYSTFAARPLINIHDLAVRPEARGRGVGSALINAVIAEARQRHCCKVTLEVRTDNVGAQRLYRRYGFTGGPPESLMQFWTLSLTD